MRNLLAVVFLCSLALVNAKAAFSQNLDEWPSPPRFDANDYPISREKAFVEKEVIPYYRFTEKSALFRPENIWHVKGLGEDALQLFEKTNTKGLFSLSPGQADSEGKTYTTLGLKRFDTKSGASSQVFYRVHGTASRVHSPLFSPNGETIVIKDGYPPDDRWNSNNLFLWDIKKGRLRLGPYQPMNFQPDGGIMLPELKWSPGSRFLSYMRGGNTIGDYDPNSHPYKLTILDVPSRQERMILDDAGLHWSWTYKGNLLFSLVPPKNAYSVFYRNGRPSVYEANALRGKPTKLFDGGYYAHESPDGEWIAFCDWPGSLFDAKGASKELQENPQRGVFLFHKPTKRRVFVGELELGESVYPADAPLFQWSPDGKTLYVLETTDSESQGVVKGQIYRMDIEQQQLQPLSVLEFKPLRGIGYFRSRGISPDGSKLYYEIREAIDGPRGFPNRQYTLLSVNTVDGKQTPIARLKNIASENPDWDFHDESGVNPAFTAAQKIEEALPKW